MRSGLWIVLVAGSLVGCLPLACAASHPAAVSPQPALADSAPESSLPTLPPGHVWRLQVMKIMSPGLGAFLQRIDVKETLIAGKFHGWRVVELRGDPSFWEGVDLRPGDVVTSVNGQPIGHHDQAYKVWRSLATVSVIEINYERGSDQRQLRYQIHDESEPTPVLSATPPRPGPVAVPRASASAPASSKPPTVQPSAPTSSAAVPAPVPPPAASVPAPAHTGNK